MRCGSVYDKDVSAPDMDVDGKALLGVAGSSNPSHKDHL